MKRLLPITLTLFLCHCGTEVGNGVAPREDAAGESANPGTEPTSTASDTKDSPSGNESLNYVLSPAFIAACASPFAESIEGKFGNSAGSTFFTVTVSQDGKKSVSRSDGSALFVITPAPAVGTYAIEALPVAPAVTCSQVTSQTLTDGSVQRSVTHNTGSVVQWTLSGGQVTSMKLTTATMNEEVWTRQNP